MKKIRQLKSKHGFTLIELIVVMAILAVLSAILIPLILGMSEKARLASVNTMAENIRKNVELFLVEAEGELYGMRPECVETFYVTVQEGSDAVRWDCSAADADKFLSGGNVTWGTAGTYSGGTTDKNGESILCQRLCDWFPDLKNGFMAITVNSGQCTFVVFSDTTNTIPDTAEFPAHDNGHAPKAFEWSGGKQGLTESGNLMGTAPQVPMSE